MLIAQLSDLHVGGGRYREELLRTAIAEINASAPVVVVVGDLTDDGCSTPGTFLSLLRQCGVDLVFSGHRHVSYVWPIAGIPRGTCPGAT